MPDAAPIKTDGGVMDTRGVRNNNPGNIERNPANAWQGRMPLDKMTPEQRAETRFEVFISAAYGIRALAILLINYFDRHGCDTVEKIIHRWAPPVENNTVSYVDAVARALWVSPLQPLNLHDYTVLNPLVQTIIAFENAGYRYPPETVEEGLRLAGVVQPDAPLVRQPAAAQLATVVALGTGGTAAVVEAINGALPVLQSMQQITAATQGLPPLLQSVAMGLVSTSIGASLYAWWRLRRARQAVQP